MTIILMVSLLVAVFVVPYLQFAFLKPQKRKIGKINFESISNAVFERVLKLCFKFPKTVILLALVCVVLGVIGYSEAMSPIEYRLSGYSEDELKVATDKVADYLRTVPVFYMVRTSFKEPLNGVVVKLNDNASKMGVNQMMAQSVLASRYSVGFPVASLWEGDRKVPVVLKGTDADSADYATLANEKMMTFGGLGSVPLRQIADMSPTFHDGERGRRNGIPTVTVSAELNYGESPSNLGWRHLVNVKKIAESENVHVEIGGEPEVCEIQLPRIAKSLALAFAIIFFILLFQLGIAPYASDFLDFGGGFGRRCSDDYERKLSLDADGCCHLYRNDCFNVPDFDGAAGALLEGPRRAL